MLHKEATRWPRAQELLPVKETVWCDSILSSARDDYTKSSHGEEELSRRGTRLLRRCSAPLQHPAPQGLKCLGGPSSFTRPQGVLLDQWDRPGLAGQGEAQRELKCFKFNCFMGAFRSNHAPNVFFKGGTSLDQAVEILQAEKALCVCDHSAPP